MWVVKEGKRKRKGNEKDAKRNERTNVQGNEREYGRGIGRPMERGEMGQTETEKERQRDRQQHGFQLA